MTSFARAPDRAPCRYGIDCYRKKAEHWLEFDHPADHPFLANASNKKQRTSESGTSAEPAPAPAAPAAPTPTPTVPAVPVPALAAPTPTAVLVFAPGSGGKTAGAMLDLHDDLRRHGLAVCRLDEQPFHWVTSSAGCAKNLDHLVAVASRAASAHPGLPLVLCGGSFGNRVCAEALRTARDRLPTRVAPALVCCGYPLNAPKKPEGADQKRPAHLRQLPAANKVLLLQGARDEYNGPRGVQALRDVVAEMEAPARVEVYEIPGGEHTVPMASGLKALGLTKEAVAAAVRDKIVGFVAGLDAAEAEPYGSDRP